MNGVGLVSALVFGGLVVYSIRRGRFPLRRGLGSVSRAKYPVAFWLLVAIFSAVAVSLLVAEVMAFLSTD